MTRGSHPPPPPLLQIFSFHVKAHLVPQVFYLLSLGITPEALPAAVLQRPMLLGEVGDQGGGSSSGEDGTTQAVMAVSSVVVALG
jgi:hypothetical protein